MLEIFDIETPLARNRFTVNVLTAMDDKVDSEGRARSYPIRMFYVVRSLFDTYVLLIHSYLYIAKCYSHIVLFETEDAICGPVV